QSRVGGQIGPRWPSRQDLRPFLRAIGALTFANQINAAFELVAVNDNLEAVAVAHLADRSPRQRFGPDMADASTGGHPGKTSVGQNGDVLAEAEMLEGAGHLVNLLHAGADRAPANQDDDIASAHALGRLALDRRHGRLFSEKHTSRPDL